MGQLQHGHDAGYGGCCGCGNKPAEGIVATMATDPVYGMKVDPAPRPAR